MMNRSNQSQEKDFLRMPLLLLNRLQEANLTATEYRLFYYLCLREHLGNKYVSLPPQREIARELGVSRRTILRAVSRLRELELFEFEITEWKCRNLIAAYSEEYSSRLKTVTDSDKNVTPCDTNVTDSDKNVTRQEPEPALEKDSEPLKDFKDLKDFKEKPALKKLKQQDQTAYDEWYEEALKKGEVSARDGEKVRMARGLYQGRYFHWEEVRKNQGHYLTEPAPRQPGQYLAALKKGFAK